MDAISFPRRSAHVCIYRCPIESWLSRAACVSVGYSPSTMEPLVLHVDGFWNSPYAFSAFICLKEKGLPFELREVNLHEQAQRRPEYVSKSVTARVPLLEHGSFL